MYSLFLTIRKIIKKRRVTRKDKSDFASINFGLGIWIDEMERRGWKDDFLMQFKHLYLLLNWFMLKDPVFPLTPALPEDQQQLLKDERQRGEVIVPRWLPCLNRQSGIYHLPCTSHDNECHYAKLLHCNVEDFHDLFSALCPLPVNLFT